MESFKMCYVLAIKTCALMTIFTLLSCHLNAEEPGTTFDKFLKFESISFHVTCQNSSSLNSLRIIPSGLAIDNSVIEKEIDGTVTGADVADLNRDGSPEIYVYINSAGSGSYGSLVAYSSNNNKSLSEIYLPPLAADSKSSNGYMGHDEFAVVGENLTRSFPLYKTDDSNANPTGGMRQLQYKLIPGEASWKLKLTK